jgi:hypothetical protein
VYAPPGAATTAPVTTPAAATTPPTVPAASQYVRPY